MNTATEKQIGYINSLKERRRASARFARASSRMIAVSLFSANKF